MADEPEHQQCVILSYLHVLDLYISPFEFQYYIDHETLTRTNQHLCLGVLFHSMMSFSPHINVITSNAIKSLNFVRRNLSNCNESVKAAVYLGLIQPKLEYTSSVIYIKTFMLLKRCKESLLDE